MSAKLLHVVYTYKLFSGMQIRPSEIAAYICITLNTATRFHWWRFSGYKACFMQ